MKLVVLHHKVIEAPSLAVWIILTTFCVFLAIATVPISARCSETHSMFRSHEAIPFQYNPQTAPLIIIKVSLNGKPPLPFMVDSGMPLPIVVDQWALEKLHIPHISHTRVNVLGKSPIYGISPIKAVRMQGVNAHNDVGFHDVPAFMANYVASLTSTQCGGAPIAGIIGIPCLLSPSPRFAFQIDFQSHLLRLCTVPSHVKASKSLTVLPLQLKHPGVSTLLGNYWARFCIFPKRHDDFLVDTGSPFSGLQHLGCNFPDGKFAKVAVHAPDSQVAFNAHADISFEDDLFVPRMMLGNTAVMNVTLRNEFYPNGATTIGLDVLSQFLVTLDIGHDRLILENFLRPGKHPIPGISGVMLEPDHAAIRWVVPNSPAARAGVITGDVVTAVEGRSLKGMPLLVEQRLIDGYVGAKVHLTVLRGTNLEASVCFVPSSHFSSDSSATLGLTLGLLGSHLEVEYVAPGCLGSALGVKAEDNVVSINNQPITNRFQGLILGNLNNQEVDIVVERKNGPILEYHLPSDQALILVKPELPPTRPTVSGHWSWYPNASWTIVP